ncbi:HNH endonuclease [Brevundimonas sp.]|uniref:HNH endonuclease n=1 Tax=Brevundimonas sp. TaxID=1871086 RepID=UPI0035B2B2BC
MADWPYTTARWQRLRKAKLSEAPLCQTCEHRGRKVVAEHVDHVVAIKQGGPAFPPMDCLRALCAPCHSIKTNALDRAGGKGVAIKGCDADGLPLDPAHPFFHNQSSLEGADVQNPIAPIALGCSHSGRFRRGEGLGLEKHRLAQEGAQCDFERAALAVDSSPLAEGFHDVVDASKLRDTPLQGREAVDQRPAGSHRTHLVRDWGV